MTAQWKPDELKLTPDLSVCLEKHRRKHEKKWARDADRHEATIWGTHHEPKEASRPDAAQDQLE